jgi:metaxin
MPPDDGKETDINPSSSNSSTFKRQTNRIRDLFSIPAPVKALFDKVPVLTYEPNELPHRTPRPTKLPALYVFIRQENAAAGRPSFNPSCLKWQVSFASQDRKDLLRIHRPSSRSLKSSINLSPQTTMPHPPALYLSFYQQYTVRNIPQNHHSQYPPTSS